MLTSKSVKIAIVNNTLYQFNLQFLYVKLLRHLFIIHSTVGL